MVLANVAAAEELERLHRPCMYRVHAPPVRGEARGAAHLPARARPQPAARRRAAPARPRPRCCRRSPAPTRRALVNEVVLRSQSQAAYSPDNIGHFGLALTRYAHFTSPIRRYADLLVHRALIAGLKLGLGGLAPDEAAEFERHRRAHQRHRAPRRAGRARRDRPLPRRLHGRQGRRHLPRAHLRRAALRPVRRHSTRTAPAGWSRWAACRTISGSTTKPPSRCPAAAPA